MLLTAVSSLIFIGQRNLIQIYPESWIQLWNKWQIRAMVLISLSLQIVLILLGSRRKYTSKNNVRIILWLAYLFADSVATASLGIISNLEGNSKDPNYEIVTFWVPFLLVHLGGPDTITAYSLEDNELWQRHLLQLLVQFGGALYILVKSWTYVTLNSLAIPMLVAGFIKYLERTLVLRSASSGQFRNSMLSPSDPGPNYAKFMDEYRSKKREGYRISVGKVIGTSTVMADSHRSATVNGIIPDALILQDAYYFFGVFKRLFADLILSFQDREKSMSFFQNTSSENAFRVIEVELGLVYDVLYTKAVIIFSWWGVIFRSITFFSTISVFIAFWTLDKSGSSGFNVGITYALLVTAIVLEIYAVIVLISSDWTMRWLSKFKSPLVDFTYRLISCCQLQSGFLFPAKNRWSNSMAQYNLISLCLNDKPAKCSGIQKCFCLYEFLEKRRYKISEVVSGDLKRLIFDRLLERSRSGKDTRVRKPLCDFRDDWSMEVEFDQSILLWHIATDLCYYTDLKNNPSSVENLYPKTSKKLSDYMLYLLVMCPFMLPNGIGQIRFQDTRAEAIEFFEDRNYELNRNKACEMLLQVNTDILPSEVKGDRSKSVLFDACRLAKSLQSLETGGTCNSSEMKWGIICDVWVEMLSFAASQCRSNYHAGQLRRGGELLTHVWLLMAHLGITDHFQIAQGHARAKLDVN